MEAATKNKGLPKVLKLWGHDYKVRKQKDPKIFDSNKKAVTVLGFYSADLEEIVINNKLPSKTREAEVFIHEILHGICYFSNVFNGVPERGEHEEHVVDTLANGICLVLRDNPDLIKYLQETLND